MDTLTLRAEQEHLVLLFAASDAVNSSSDVNKARKDLHSSPSSDLNCLIVLDVSSFIHLTHPAVICTGGNFYVSIFFRSSAVIGQANPPVAPGCVVVC